MTSRLNPYLLFRGQAREALAFYHEVFGGAVSFMTFGDFEASGDAEVDELVMHGQLESATGYWIMASDVPPGMDFQPGQSVTMCLNGDDEAELTGYWDKLSEGATIGMALARQGWGDIYGDLVDRFGVHWSVDIGPER